MIIALAGNPNCGKTTLFNTLTGSNQYVGNWPGVTVEKKEGKLKGHKDVIVQDLPGIYSLSPYTLEEVVTRNYLVKERPDAILNIIDGTNIERNLYLTSQLLELGLPVVTAINMMDVVNKRGDCIYLAILSDAMGCQFVEMSALKGEGDMNAVDRAIEAANRGIIEDRPNIFVDSVGNAIAHIEKLLMEMVDAHVLRWYAIKVFERDEKVLEELKLKDGLQDEIEQCIEDCQIDMDDDSESIITNQRYGYISTVVDKAVRKKATKHSLSASDKIDRIVTNRWLALPIFAAVMFLVYFISIGTLGAYATDWTNDTLFGTWIIPAIEGLLEGWGCAAWLVSLIADGIIGGVGAVLGFVPQMLILFVFLAMLEDIGYMARIAFIMDRIFRRFGLSGKSFIPMLISSGCGVPGVMASRTIEQDRDRKMTIMTTCFIPCGAKMPIVGLIAGALFGGSAWVAVSAYFIGVAAVIVSGVILKKTKPFSGKPAPFVMELPQYHAPVITNVLRSTWERGWSFVKRAGTVIFVASIIIWLLNSLSFETGLHYIFEGDDSMSILNAIGEGIAFIFAPLGFGKWQAAVATMLGLVAKEEVVGVFGSLSSMFASANPEAAADLLGAMEGAISNLDLVGTEFFGGSGLAAYSFLVFNLLCAPCFAAMGAIKREMNSAKWTFAAIGYMCGFAYAISLILYQLGMFFSGAGFTIWTAAAFILLGLMTYMLFCKNKYGKEINR
ncbi:MAG: ferrous iron transport protein B [Eubacteriales bacterium]|nr:ferrous iron transport protein B [Eubacteriales bacterium]